MSYCFSAFLLHTFGYIRSKTRSTLSTNYMYPVKVDVVLIFIFQLFFNEAFSNNFVGLYILVDNRIVFFRTSYGNLSNLSVSSFIVMISHYEPPFFRNNLLLKVDLTLQKVHCRKSFVVLSEKKNKHENVHRNFKVCLRDSKDYFFNKASPSTYKRYPPDLLEP